MCKHKNLHTSNLHTYCDCLEGELLSFHLADLQGSALFDKILILIA